MSLRRSMATAVGDSALASLATFAVGLYAARYLSLVELGAYGILFVAAFVLGSSTITQLYFTPVEVAYVEMPQGAQLSALRRSAPAGLAGGAVLGVLVVAGGALVVPDLGWGSRVTLGIGAAAVAAASPAQDHVRRVLHQAGRSPRAMQVSAVQLLVAAGMVVALSVAGLDPLAIPFTALAVANVASLAVGLLLAHVDAGDARGNPPPLRGLLRLGGWLVLSGQADQVAGFVGVAVLGALSGASAVGHYEAARQLAQPLFVLSTGLLSVLRPRVMTAAQQADAPTGRRFTWLYMAALGVAGGLYTLVAGVSWPGNPLIRLFPHAFARSGMFPALIIATAVAFVGPILGIQAVAARRERDMVRISMTNQFVYIGAVAVLAAPLGALAMPAASMANSLVWLLRFRPVLRRIYGAQPAPATLAAPVLGG